MEPSDAGRSDPIRAIMLDPARLTERHDFYLDLIPRLAEWGYNAIWWHFCDDEGFALKLESHPELASPYALSIEQTTRLIELAAEFGISIIPEVESLGHTLAITSRPEYSHLFNGNRRGHNAICPSHPDTIPLLRQIIREVAAIFPATFFHAGLDESVIGNCQRCSERQKDGPEWRIFADHVKLVHRIVSGLGRRMIMWADGVEKHPALLAELPRDIVLAHWHYSEIPRDRIVPSVEAGFEIVCVPAISQGMVLSPDLAYRNIDEMVELADELGDRCLGLAVCWWESFRVLRDAMYPTIAYAGRAGTAGNRPDHAAFVRRFSEDFFRLNDNPEVAEALSAVHDLALSQSQMHAFFPASPADLPATMELVEQSDFEQKSALAMVSAKCLANEACRVEANLAAFEAIRLAADIIAAAYANGRQLATALESYRQAAAAVDTKAPLEQVMQIFKPALQALAESRQRVCRLVRRVSDEWDRTRYPEDDKKDNTSPRIGQRGARALLPVLLQSSDFLDWLANGAEEALKQPGIAYLFGSHWRWCPDSVSQSPADRNRWFCFSDL